MQRILFASALLALTASLGAEAHGPKAVARFSRGDVKGYVVADFKQDEAAPGEPIIGVNFTMSLTGFTNSTGRYSFHIHQTKFAEFAADGITPTAYPAVCDTTGGHWDPTRQAAQPGGYRPVAGNLSSYETGDLSGKFGGINMSAIANGQVLRSFYDPTITLFPGELTQYSIVFHDSAKPAAQSRIACANIVILDELMAWAKLKPAAGSSVSGGLMMHNVGEKPGSMFHFEKMAGLVATKSYRFSVRQNNVTNDDCSTVGPVFDPFKLLDAAGKYKVAPKSGDFSSYALGDLDGKFGAMPGSNPNLNLTDSTAIIEDAHPHTLLGRAIVVQEIDSDRIVACGTIRNTMSADDEGMGGMSPSPSPSASSKPTRGSSSSSSAPAFGVQSGSAAVISFTFAAVGAAATSWL